MSVEAELEFGWSSYICLDVWFDVGGKWLNRTYSNRWIKLVPSHFPSVRRSNRWIKLVQSHFPSVLSVARHCGRQQPQPQGAHSTAPSVLIPGPRTPLSCSRPTSSRNPTPPQTAAILPRRIAHREIKQLVSESNFDEETCITTNKKWN